MQRKATFARWSIALSQTLKCHLRPGYAEDLSKDLGAVLCKEELELVMTADHKVSSWQSIFFFVSDACFTSLSCTVRLGVYRNPTYKELPLHASAPGLMI